MSTTPATAVIAEFEYPREVHFVDTDVTGFAHFSVYVRMMEETEYAFLRSRGLRVVLHDELGTLGFPRLTASLKINQPLVLGDCVKVKLKLVEIDGKQIVYEFEIVDQNRSVAVEGRFCVAVCRFPDDAPPYAVLTPQHVMDALLGET